ncbi:MAG: hypothetical protein JNN00_06630 [Chitinophagaceae bacterium]|nr:hypothetical protein [Chitinophagaceae bacterium]
MPILDEKKDVILSILEKLRAINPQIGQYDKSILNEDSTYAVKLTNGRIDLPAELVHDYEQSTSFVTEEQLKAAASRFKSAQPVKNYPAATATLLQTEAPRSYFNEVSTKGSGTSGLKKLLILTVIIVLGLAGYFIYTKTDKEKKEITIKDNKEEIRNNINSYVTAETNNYKYSELGGIYGLVITIRNNTDYLLENVKVEITYIKANGDVWRNKETDFEMLSPHSIGTITVADTDRGVKVQCRIISIKSTALGL